MPIHNTKPSLYSIQMLRAIAALLVLLHHALPHYEVMGGSVNFIKQLSSWGFAGVDIFFIISGFIMAYTTLDKPRTISNAKTFIKHRLLRIYLGYWPFFIGMLFILFMKDPNHLEKLDLLGSFTLFQSNMFKLVLPVSWSLSYELYFYLLFAATFFLTRTQLYRVIPTVTFILLIWALYVYKNAEIYESFFYSSFLLEFFAGVLLFMFHRSLFKVPLLFILIPLIFVAYTLGIDNETKNGLMRIATFGTGALGIVWSVLILEKSLDFKPPTFLISIGNASYTLYLFHLLFLEIFYYVGLRNIFTSEHSQLLPALGLSTIVILTTLFSLLYYKMIEKPLYQYAIKKR